MRYRSATVASAVIGLLLTVFAVAPAAASTGSAVVSAAGHGSALAAVHSAKGAGTAAAADVITCTPNVQNPHNSSHVNGTVNVVVTLSCTAPVTYISIRAALYRNGSLVKDSGSKTVYGTSSAQNNAAEPCHNATYQGWMSYYVQFPPGYTPPSGSSQGFGNAVAIVC